MSPTHFIQAKYRRKDNILLLLFGKFIIFKMNVALPNNGPDS